MNCLQNESEEMEVDCSYDLVTVFVEQSLIEEIRRFSNSIPDCKDCISYSLNSCKYFRDQ